MLRIAQLVISPSLRQAFANYQQKPTSYFRYDCAANHDQGLSNVDLEMLRIFVIEHPEISYLDIQNYRDSSADIGTLIEILELPNIKFVTLYACRLSVNGIRLLAQSKVKNLGLPCSKINDQTASILATSTSLISLTLTNNNIGDVGVNALAQSASLMALCIDGQIPNLSMSSMYTLISKSKLRYLNIVYSYNVERLADVDLQNLLAQNRYLTHLDIYQSNLPKRIKNILARNKAQQIYHQLRIMLALSVLKARKSACHLSILPADLLLLILAEAYEGPNMFIPHAYPDNLTKIICGLAKTIFERGNQLDVWLKNRNEDLSIMKDAKQNFSLLFQPKQNLQEMDQSSTDEHVQTMQL